MDGQAASARKFIPIKKAKWDVPQSDSATSIPTYFLKTSLSSNVSLIHDIRTRVCTVMKGSSVSLRHHCRNHPNRVLHTCGLLQNQMCHDALHVGAGRLRFHQMNCDFQIRNKGSGPRFNNVLNPAWGVMSDPHRSWFCASPVDLMMDVPRFDVGNGAFVFTFDDGGGCKQMSKESAIIEVELGVEDSLRWRRYSLRICSNGWS